MQVIGLTGGIGVGKSTVAAMLGELGATIIDVDELGRQVIAAGGSAVDAVVERFGESVRADDGSIDRPTLAGMVFGDAEALAALNAISHPAINELLDERLGEIAEHNPAAVVVLDMAVLTESTLGQGISHPYEQVIVVEAPVEVRITRLLGRGLTRDDAEARMASQANDTQRRAIADYLVSNGDRLGALRRSVNQLWTEVTRSSAPVSQVPLARRGFD